MNSPNTRILIFLVALLGSIAAVYLLSNDGEKVTNTASEEPHLSEYRQVHDAPLPASTAPKDTALAPPVVAKDTVTTDTLASVLPATPVPVKQTRKKAVSNLKKKTTKPRPKRKKVRRYATMAFDETHYDFGDITEGDIIKHSFSFTNTSDVPLDIVSAKASCGCTQPTFPFLTIEPGQSNKIDVTYHSVSKSGEQTPEITIVANTNPSPIVLTMSGTVLPKEEKEDEEKDGKEEKQQIEDNPLDTPASVDTIK